MNRIQVSICLGSSCFARGNQNVVHLIKDYLRRNGLENRVYFRGAHCFGACKNGPSLKIGDELFHGISQDNVFEILENALNNHETK